jgi:YesN/AraC family two-component response regulator
LKLERQRYIWSLKSELIVDDNDAIGEGVRSVLTQYVGWEVCSEAIDGDAISKAKCLKPDVIILDVRMPRLGGLEAPRL